MTIQTRNAISQSPEIFDEGSRIFYAGVCISSEAVFELDGNHILVKVPKQEVLGGALERGSAAENPKLQFGFGALLTTVGVAGTIPLLDGNFGAIRYEIGLVFLGALGAWMLWEAARRKTYLSLATLGGRRKVRFHGAVERNKLTSFLDLANLRFSYNFEVTEG